VIRNKHLLSLQIFNGMRFGTAILIAVVLAKVAGTDLIGLYESLILVGTTVTFFYASAINHTLVPFVGGISKGSRHSAYSSALIILVAGSLVSLLSMVIYGRLIDNVRESYFIFYYASYILLNTPALLAENILVVEKRKRSLVIYGVLAFSAQVAAICFPLLNSEFDSPLIGDLHEAILYLTLVAAGKLLYTLYLIKKHSEFKWNGKEIRELLRISSPVMGSLFLANGYLYLSTFLVKFQANTEQFNIFRYGAREFPLFMIMANSFSTIKSGELAEKLNELKTGLKQMKTDTARLAHQLFPIAIILSLLSKPLFRWAFNSDLAPAHEIFSVLLLLLTSRLLFPQSILLAMKRNHSMIYASAIEFAIGLGLSIWWMPLYGIHGVAWAMVIAHLVDKLVLIYHLNEEGIGVRTYVPLRLLLIYSVLLLCAISLDPLSTIVQK